MEMAGSPSSGVYAGTWNPWLRKFEQESGCQFEILQVKEKFGGLRIYVSGANDAVRQRLEAAKMESTRTCEVRRQPGALREGSWTKTLCDEHTTIN
jgi:hypothetical protein